MSTGDVVSYAMGAGGLVIGAGGLGAGYYYFWQGKRRNQLKISFTSQSLLGDDPSVRAKVSVRCDEQPINEPNLVTVSLVCLGPKDIRADDFENGRPLRIQLSGMIAAVLLGIDELSIETTGGEVHIPPGLIPKGKAFTVKVITDGGATGESSSAIVSPLAQTDIVTGALIR
jgi:hypothetical protein